MMDFRYIGKVAPMSHDACLEWMYKLFDLNRKDPAARDMFKRLGMPNNFQYRNMYEFFDVNDVHISIEAIIPAKDEKRTRFKAIIHCNGEKSWETEKPYSISRIATEEEAIINAFKILEKKE